MKRLARFLLRWKRKPLEPILCRGCEIDMCNMPRTRWGGYLYCWRCIGLIWERCLAQGEAINEPSKWESMQNEVTGDTIKFMQDMRGNS